MIYETYQRPAMYACSKAGWPEYLNGAERTCAELAAHANISVSRALRLIRACMSADMFRETSAGTVSIDDGERRYVNTPTSDVLREDHPYTMKPILLYMTEDFFLPLLELSKLWHDESAIPFAAVHGLPNTPEALWHYYARLPRQHAEFNRGMTSMDAIGVPALVHDFPWAGRCAAVVDVAGGQGTLLAGILAAAPAARGVLMDLPPVVEQSRAHWARRYPGLAGRVEFVPGSFFEAGGVPPSAGDGRHCYTTKVPPPALPLPPP